MCVHAIVADELCAVDAIAGGGLGVLAAVALLFAADACKNKFTKTSSDERHAYDNLRLIRTVVAGLFERLLLDDEPLVDHVGHLALQPARRARDRDALCACGRH